jgi:hypothetical protein
LKARDARRWFHKAKNPHLIPPTTEFRFRKNLGADTDGHTTRQGLNLLMAELLRERAAIDPEL